MSTQSCDMQGGRREEGRREEGKSSSSSSSRSIADKIVERSRRSAVEVRKVTSLTDRERDSRRKSAPIPRR